MPEPVSGARATPSASATSCAVRPGLHDPGGGHRGGRHPGAEPGQFLAGRDGGERVGQRRPAGPPAGSSSAGGARNSSAPSSTSRVGSGARGHAARERLGVGGGEQRDVVGPGEVGDLVRDGPARRRGRSRPAGPGRRRPGRRAVGGLGGQVREQVREVDHGASGVVAGFGGRSGVSRRRAGVSRCAAGRSRRAESSVSRLATPEPAQQVEGGLHGLADAGTALVDAEQRDGQPVHLAATRASSGTRASRSSGSVRAATHSSSAATKSGPVNAAPSRSITRSSRCGPAGQRLGLGAQLLGPPLGEVRRRRR